MPEEFWKLTPAEFNLLTEGYLDREDREMTKLAWHASNIMNVHLKKKVTVKKLLGKEKVMTVESKEEEFNKLIELLNKKQGVV